MSDEPTSALLMFVAHRAAEARVFEAVRTAGFDDLTLAQSRICQRLNREGIRVTDIAEQAGVTKQTAGALVDELEATGYVTRRPDPADARARLVVLTDRGEKLCATAAAEIAKVEADWRAHLGADDLRRAACGAGVAARDHRSVPLTALARGWNGAVTLPRATRRRSCRRATNSRLRILLVAVDGRSSAIQT